MTKNTNNKAEFFDIKHQPVRDPLGFTFHPDLDLFTRDGEFDHELLKVAGFAVAEVGMAGDDPQMLARYQEEEFSLIYWEPTPPDTRHEWRLVAIHDMPTAPEAIFVRRLKN